VRGARRSQQRFAQALVMGPARYRERPSLFHGSRNVSLSNVDRVQFLLSFLLLDILTLSLSSKTLQKSPRTYRSRAASETHIISLHLCVFLFHVSIQIPNLCSLYEYSGTVIST